MKQKVKEFMEEWGLKPSHNADEAESLYWLWVDFCIFYYTEDDYPVRPEIAEEFIITLKDMGYHIISRDYNQLAICIAT